MSDKLLEGDAALGHLLRRAGFGMTPDQFDAYRKLGYRQTVRRLLDELGEPVPADPDGFDPYVPGAIQQLWLDRMHGGRSPLAEKLAFFWHGHFATSDAKIQEPHLMWQQYKLFRGQGAGKFRELVEKVSRDVAMIRWLDSNANRKGAANENYARELQELFTLGIGNYTETDIREIARAFTGWGSRHHDFVYTEPFHDAGEKVVHGQRGAWNGDDVVRIITGLPASRAFIAGKLLRFFSHPNPSVTEIAALSEVLQKTDGDIRATLFVLFHSPEFRATAHHRVLVRSPVEFQIGALRATKVEAVPRWSHGALDRMGQILFRPPSVKGWTSGTGWLTAASVVERFKAARRIADAAPGRRSGSSKRPSTVSYPMRSPRNSGAPRAKTRWRWHWRRRSFSSSKGGCGCSWIDAISSNGGSPSAPSLPCPASPGPRGPKKSPARAPWCSCTSTAVTTD